MSGKRIGEFLVEKKILTPLQVEQIVEYGKRERMRFGEAGLKLGLLSEEALVRVFGKNYRVDFFHLDGKFFPKQTSELLGIDTILRYGVLPLGYKSKWSLFRRKKVLNLGMLDPGRQDARDVALREAHVGEGAASARVFLVLADQFLDVLQAVYGIGPADLARRGAGDLDPTLSLFIEERA